MRISPADRIRVCDAIRAAEGAAAGEFVCVLTRSASDYRVYPLAWAVLGSLLTPWILLEATLWSFETILLAQLLVFAVLLPALSWLPVRRRIVPRAVQRAAAHRAAAEQFLIRGLAHTPHRRGILLFVAEEEHYARVLADEGVVSVVPGQHWADAVADMVNHSRAGRHADGFVAALDRCAAVLREQFPAEAPGSKVLPDRFYVLE